MKLVSFSTQDGTGYGVVENDHVIDLSTRMKHPSLRALIAADEVGEAARLASTLKPDYPLSGIRLLPPIPDPGKIICVGLNYHAHVAETGRKLTEKPALFNRFAESQIGHLAPMIKPIESDHLDYEGELAIVIGKPGRKSRKRMPPAISQAIPVTTTVVYATGSITRPSFFPARTLRELVRSGRGW